MEDEMKSPAILPSSLPRIPQSVIRPSDRGSIKKPLLPSIQATPTRKSAPASKPNRRLIDAGGLDSSPLQPRRSSTHLFVPNSGLKLPASLSSQGIQETPVKKRLEISTSHLNLNVLAPGSDKESSKAGESATSAESRNLQVSQTSIEHVWDAMDDDDLDDLA